MWAESCDLPRLQRGRFDVGWAIWLKIGREICQQWRTKPSASVAVAAGWLQAQNGIPSAADLAALGDLFKRNGFDVEDAVSALGAAQAGFIRRA
jgi:hypothetical protein